MSYHNLGKIGQKEKNFSLASEYFQKSIRIFSNYFDERHELLIKLNNDFQDFLSVKLLSMRKNYLIFNNI